MPALTLPSLLFPALARAYAASDTWARPSRAARAGAETGRMLDERDTLAAALAERARAPRGAPSGPAELALFRYLAPAVQARVYRTLAAHAPQWLRRDPRATVEDLTQLVLCGLFDDDARVLRLWSADRPDALGLREWVGRFASLRVRDQLRVQKQFEWRHVGEEPGAMERRSGSERPDAAVETAQLWDAIRADMQPRLSELGRALFSALIEEDRSNAEVKAAHGLSDDAVYQWRRRLRVEVEATWRRLKGDP